ncbi:MAG: hypothetical protein JNK87_08235, partial [Bryobacterales bacterium]|nr:hypothetical protein [Bryobacterales bacterium]
MRSKTLLLAALALAAIVTAQNQNYDAPPSYVPTPEELKPIRDALPPLQSKLTPVAKHARYADAAIYAKAIDWILRHPEEFYQKQYVPNALKVIETGNARAADLAAGRTPWVDLKGKPVARAYVSKVDGSLQPYQVTVPHSYNGTPMRLDVVLHGRNARLNEVSFLSAVEASKAPVLEDRIELQVYGRTNNAYRWAGETDVFEAIDAVKRDFKIDDKRIVLRGFSMGGAGGWHLGLHYPHIWAGIEAGAGFSETLRYAKQDKAPDYARRAWPVYDSYLYARNTLLVPTVGYGSIDDPQLQASVNVKEQLAKENLPNNPALFLVGPKIGHKFAPESKAESEAWITARLPKQMPNPAKFLTYTTRYGRYDWLLIDGLERHYDRAEVEASREGNTAKVITKNVARLVFNTPLTVTIDGESLGSNIRAAEKHDGKWKKADLTPKTLRKRHGLQGPIDDAFL